MRIKVTISYDGSKFHGFQIQTDNKLKTIAGELAKILKRLNIQTNITGSGRTDTGVHAISQVIHFEIPSFWSNLDRLKDKINQQLPDSIYIKKITKVDKNFHARYGAKKRLYRYVLYAGKYQPFYAPYALYVKDLNTKKLNDILQNFIGIYDFEYFKKTGSQTASNTREIFKAGAYKHKGATIIYFLGNSFLRSQVRMMSYFALKVMQDKFTCKQLKEQLNKTKKHSTGVIPAHGLYLSKIYY